MPVRPTRHAADPGPGSVRLIAHGPLKLRLRWRLGILQRFLDAHSFWAGGRSRSDLRRMLGGSSAVVSAWRNGKLLGFGRATSDGVFRAVLWDVVVAEGSQGQGLGRRIVEELLRAPAIKPAERIYLMTTRGSRFYERLGFSSGHGQTLLVRGRLNNSSG